MENESEEDTDFIPILRDFRYESFEDTSETESDNEFSDEEISDGMDGVQTHSFERRHLNIVVFLILPGLPNNLLLIVAILYLALMNGMIRRRLTNIRASNSISDPSVY